MSIIIAKIKRVIEAFASFAPRKYPISAEKHSVSCNAKIAPPNVNFNKSSGVCDNVLAVIIPAVIDANIVVADVAMNTDIPFSSISNEGIGISFEE